VEIDVELVKRLPEPEEGKTYRIENVEYVETPLQKLRGWRVTLREASTGSLAATMLWHRHQVGSTSKLGSFLAVLGKRTEEWVGKQILFIAWRRRERKIAIPTEGAPGDVEKCLGAIKERLEPERPTPSRTPGPPAWTFPRHHSRGLREARARGEGPKAPKE
jgi:hypothetical protein